MNKSVRKIWGRIKCFTKKDDLQAPAYFFVILTL